MNLKLILLSLLLPLLTFAQEPKPEVISKEIVTGIEEQLTKIEEGKFVLITYINGSVEIICTVKPAKDWDNEYRKSLEAKIVLTISRGGFIFHLIQIKEKEKVLI